MARYLIFFNQQWVPDYSAEEFVEISAESHALMARMQEEGVVVFAGGLAETPSLASAVLVDGEPVVSDGPYAQPDQWLGGFTVIDVEDEAAARRWTGEIARACRWPQELRAFGAGSIRG